jgi:hypothetical protein
VKSFLYGNSLFLAFLRDKFYEAWVQVCSEPNSPYVTSLDLFKVKE